jgi:uncharacterized repeat protein (TIGR01451 family)
MVMQNRPWGAHPLFAAFSRLNKFAASLAAGFSVSVLFRSVLFVGGFFLYQASAVAAPAGTLINNTANIQFDVGGVPVVQASNTLGITTVASPATPGTPTPGVLLTKTTGKTSVSIGDVLQYRLRFDNTGSGLNLTNVRVEDTLPVGMRYRKGSTKMDGRSVADPTISRSGQHLVFSLGAVAAGEVVELHYVVEVVSGLSRQTLTNRAVLFADGGVSSNATQASVLLKDELFRSEAFLEGRVIVGSCDPQGETGLEGVRIYLEDGTYVLTDEEGKWHIEGVKPGTHVVQLDKDSLPDEYEPRLCEDHTRHADTAFSQFVDVQGGSLWRADFYLQTKASSIFIAPNNRVNFDFDKDQTDEKNSNLIEKMADRLIKEDASIFVEGHTDSIGGDSYNQDLSRRRAQFVAQRLATYGVREEQMEIEPFGASHPVADNRLDEGRAINRRVDITKNPEGYDVLDKAEEKLQNRIRKNNGSFYDSEWLNQQNSQFAWVYPEASYNPVTPSTHVGIKHGSGYQVQLWLNGKQVDGLNYEGQDKNKTGAISLSRWRGVNLQEGDNLFEAVLLRSSGRETQRIQHIVHYSGEPEDGELVAEQSLLAADGKRSPLIAVRLTDKAGYPARPGLEGVFTVDAPYASQESVKDQREGQVNRERRESSFFVGNDGVALLKLQPTTQSGQVTVRIKLADGREKKIQAWLSPGSREWIFVGLAELQLGENDVSGNLHGLKAAGLEEGFYDEGRMAFFAKGQIKGEWLLTAAYDSDKDKYQRFRQVIDPDTYYTLYGDQTSQAYDAASTEKLYLKLEKKDFYAMFGDYETDLTDTELSTYNRSATGLKVDHHGKHWRTRLFAMESDQAYLRDEVRGDGTSGLYQLGRRDILINTDKIRIETRDRFHSEKILSVEYMTRHIDYNIDYNSGTLYFRKAIPGTDNQQNPIYIVAEYEAPSGDDQDITAGGRAAYYLTEKTYAGVTVLHEGNTGAKADLVGMDASLQLSETLVLKTEYASSDKQQAGVNVDGSAYLLELSHDGDKLDANLYIREQEAGFGLGQQNSSESGTRKTGAELRYDLNNQHAINTQMYQQKDLVNDATRNVTEATYDYEKDGDTTYIGTRVVKDKYQGGMNTGSSQLLLGGSTTALDKKLTLRADSEWVLDNQATGESLDFPDRIQLGADYRVTEILDLLFDQEFSWGDQQDYQGSTLGVRLRPWQGMEANTGVGLQSGDWGNRTFANLGLVQSWNINQAWRFDGSLDRSQTLDQSGTPYPPAAFQADRTEDYTAVSLGVAYLTADREWSTRLENRHADTEEKTNLFMGYLQKLRDGLAMSLGMALSDADRIGDEHFSSGDIRYSLAYRPVSSDWTVFDRLDYLWDEERNTNSDYRSRRLVNNLLANYKPDGVNQLSLQYSAKYMLDQVEGDEYDGFLDLAGFEYRRNLVKRRNMNWDAGFHAHSLNHWDSGTHQLSWGVSAGFSPEKNVWVSLGYNFDGFRDDDFSGSDYTAKGLYLKLRVKVDQDSLRELWAR